MSICPQMLFVTVLSQLTQKQFPLKHTRVSKTFKLALAYKAGFIKKAHKSKPANTSSPFNLFLQL